MIDIKCLLFYDYDVIAIILNYVSLVLCIVVFLVFLYAPHPYISRLKMGLWLFGFLLFLIIFQITLCIVIGCFGISIVWNAIFGITLHQSITKNGIMRITAADRNILHWIIIIISCMFWLGTDIFYIFDHAEFETNFVHFTTIFMGALLGYVANSYTSAKAFDRSASLRISLRSLRIQ